MGNSTRINWLLIAMGISIAAVGYIFIFKRDVGIPGPGAGRLQGAASPYLQQHADNPVDWYEWGNEALQKAGKENKPLLISIGYASCHWCHVMEEECFMDTAVARLMNEYFVCIKVDREERPDIDKVYVDACRLLNDGNAGWPLNAFALPDGKPFFAGTYYSKEGWKKLLQQVAENYRRQHGKIVLQANSLVYGLIDQDSILLQSRNDHYGTGKPVYDTFFSGLYATIDSVNGGIRSLQKFPSPVTWEFMLQYNYLTGHKGALDAAVNTLEKMSLGGLYDHVGGGFARYATDSLWRVPHFEKMLCDNAQLVSLYAHAYQVTQNNYFRSIVESTLAFLERELLSATGGFYSSLNANTPDGEGMFYSWSAEELNELDHVTHFALLKKYFNVTGKGNWQAGRNILFAGATPEAFADAQGIPSKDFELSLKAFREKLLQKRNRRTRPVADSKILCSWNALMVQAYATAYGALGKKEYLERAIQLATFITKYMVNQDGSVRRNYSGRKHSVAGFLDDYSYLAKAYCTLYESTFDKQWLDQARRITGYVIQNFYDPPTGYFFYTARNAGSLAIRKKEIIGNELPSSNAVFCEVLMFLGSMYQDEDYLRKGERMIQASANFTAIASAAPGWARLAGMAHYGINEIAIVGEEAKNKCAELRRHYLPTSYFLGGAEEDLPILRNKLLPNNTLIYVCRNKVCKKPVRSAAEALVQTRRATSGSRDR